jgi:hypothetical protein
MGKVMRVVVVTYWLEKRSVKNVLQMACGQLENERAGQRN